jgi:hypothetical protein
MLTYLAAEPPGGSVLAAETTAGVSRVSARDATIGTRGFLMV